MRFLKGKISDRIKLRPSVYLHGGAELDLLVVRGQRRMGFEIKRTTSPQITPSMRYALLDLHLRSLDVIYAGETTFPMDKKIRAVAFRRLLQDIKPLT